MSAGTLVGRLARALKRKPILKGLCLAEHPDAKLWAFSPLQATEWALCAASSGNLQGSGEKFVIH